MSTPSFVVRHDQLAPDRSLRRRDLDEAKSILRHGGLLLLPSDTCYSLAGCIHNVYSLDHITKILGRPRIPFSITVRHIAAAEKWVDMPEKVRALFKEYTPGPITVICRAHKEYEPFTKDQIRSIDCTIGFRIPGSIIEREIVSELAEDEMITTTAVRDSEGKSIREFSKAFDIVKSGTDRLENSIPWGAIEYTRFLNRDSILVRYNHGSMNFEILPRPDSDNNPRPGTYTFEEIKEILQDNSAQTMSTGESP